MVSGYGYNPLMDPKLVSAGVDLLTRAIPQTCPAASSPHLSGLPALMHFLI